MNENVRNAVDVPRNADRVDETKRQHHPKRRSREEPEQREKINAVEKSGYHWNRIPPRVGENSRRSAQAFAGHVGADGPRLGRAVRGDISATPRVATLRREFIVSDYLSIQ